MIDDQVILPEPDTLSNDQEQVEQTYENDDHEFQDVSDTPEVVEESEPSHEQPESKADRNWREMRERTQRIERERDEAISLLKRIEQEALAYQQQTPAKKQESIYDIDDDEIIEGRHLKMLVKNELEATKKTMAQYQRQQEESLIERQIKDTYQDWDQVVNHETVKILNEQYPDIAYSLSLNPDIKKKATSTYTLMKKLGISSDGSYETEKKKVQTNLSKPRSSHSAAPQQGESPLNRANAFATGATKEDLKRLWQEMLDCSGAQ